MSKNFLKLFNSIFPFIDFLYILQLEEYDSSRFLKILPRFILRRNIQKRDTLKFTSRIQTTLLLTIGLLGVCMEAFFFLNILPVSVIIPLLIPFFVLLANVLLTPFYEQMKLRVQHKAKKYFAKHNKMDVIAIAGSYGKTTTKNFLFDLLQYNYKIQMVPGNINTPTGIAVWILKELKPQTEILLVEMDTYFKGEIKRSCDIVKPNISIITSIGDQHVERFGTVRNMAEAILEVFTCAQKNAMCYLFEEDFMKLKQLKLSLHQNIHRIGEPNRNVKTNITSDSAKKDLCLVLEVLKNFTVSEDIMTDTLMHLKHPDRRQKIDTLHGFTAIDDSYNISFATAKAAINELRKLGAMQKKKTVVVTAGIPELGPDNLDANKKYGKLLLNNVNEVIILNSIYAKDLMHHDFHLINSLPEAWKYIEAQFDPKKYVLLIQPELTDLYYNS